MIKSNYGYLIERLTLIGVGSKRDAEQFNKMRESAQAYGTGLTTQFKQSPPRLTASAEPTGK